MKIGMLGFPGVRVTSPKSPRWKHRGFLCTDGRNYGSTLRLFHHYLASVPKFSGQFRLAKAAFVLYFCYREPMEELQHTELPPRQDVRICLSAFRDAHVILPRLSGRARLRRQNARKQG